MATRYPRVVPDSLDSRQYATVLDLISEGPIESVSQIYLDDTPYTNFGGVGVDIRYGTQDQSHIPLAEFPSEPVVVGVEVANNLPVTRQITDTDVDAVRITLLVPALQMFGKDGTTDGNAINFQIQVSYNGGGYATAINDVIRGRTTDPFQADYLVNLTPGFTTADIRVVRLTPSDDDLVAADAKFRLQSVSVFQWSLYTEIKYVRLRYPNSALVALRLDAEQFSNIPSRSYRVRGIKVAIPNNATVDSSTGRLVYAGVWNGTFHATKYWTTDPAWILWDLLTSTRYGFGDHVTAVNLDKWAFYSASQYASALVPDGFGGVEPRFSCNVNIQAQADAYKLINDMCSVFRVMPYWGYGTLTINQDKPTTPVYLFTLANVTEEGFTYQGSSRKIRPTIAVVSYLDLETREKAFEVVEDQDGIARYGVVKEDIEAFACTSRGQAHRLGEWLLYSERYESEVVSFTTSIEAGALIRPGQVIEVSDPVRAGIRSGGRITSATASAITVDEVTGIAFSVGATLSVILPTGDVETRAVQSITGNTITVTTAFSIAPNSNSVWVYKTASITTSTWRVITVAESDEGHQYTITALAYNAGKYDYIERDIPLPVRDVTDMNIAPLAPVDLRASELLYESFGAAKVKLLVSWRPVIGVAQYQVHWRKGDNNWVIETVSKPDYEILDSDIGSYRIRVFSLSSVSIPSVSPAELIIQTQGKTAPPASVTGLSVVPIDTASAIISWDRSTELDVTLGGKVLIRHNAAATGALWEDSQEIVAAAAGSQTQKQVPLLSGTYLLKFEDDGGRRSTTAATASIQLPTPQPRLLVQSYREDQETPPFSGNVVDMVYSTELDGLILATGIPIDSLATDGNFDALVSIDNVSGSAGIGEYEFGSTFDLGGVYDLNIRRHFVTHPYAPGELFDDELTSIDSWPSIDGTLYDNVNAALYLRSTNDDPNTSPTWTPWTEFANVITRGRAFQFKTIATSTNDDQNILIDELGCELELQQRAASAGPLTTSAAAYAVTFAQPFYQTPQVVITGYNMAAGDYYVINSPTRLGFTITFYDTSANMIARQFSYTAIGYGREVI